MKAWPCPCQGRWQHWPWAFIPACLLLCPFVFLERAPTGQTKRFGMTLHLMCLFSYNLSAPRHLAHGGWAADINLVMDVPRPQSSSVLEAFEHICSLTWDGLGLFWMTAIQSSPSSHGTLVPGPPADTKIHRCSSPYTIKLFSTVGSRYLRVLQPQIRRADCTLLGTKIFSWDWTSEILTQINRKIWFTLQ